jgi:hypothetical protein
MQAHQLSARTEEEGYRRAKPAIRIGDFAVRVEEVVEVEVELRQEPLGPGLAVLDIDTDELDVLAMLGMCPSEQRCLGTAWQAPRGPDVDNRRLVERGQEGGKLFSGGRREVGK